MNCEIEFLAVGARSKPGDAIIVRYGEPDNYELMVVDGGASDSGTAMVVQPDGNDCLAEGKPSAQF